MSIYYTVASRPILHGDFQWTPTALPIHTNACGSWSGPRPRGSPQSWFLSLSLSCSGLSPDISLCLSSLLCRWMVLHQGVWEWNLGHGWTLHKERRHSPYAHYYIHFIFLSPHPFTQGLIRATGESGGAFHCGRVQSVLLRKNALALMIQSSTFTTTSWREPSLSG